MGGGREKDHVYTHFVQEVQQTSDDYSGQSASSLFQPNLGIPHQNYYHPPQERTSKYTNRRRCFSTWYLEIISALLAATSLGVLVYILSYMQDQPLDIWPYVFPSFSAMIAVLATIAEFALIFPAGKCIAQLKWIYIRQPRPLQRLDDYDGASKGPLGALKFVGKFLLHPIVFRPEMLGALIIAASVSMNTVSQQIFSLYSQDVLRPNNTATIGVMTAYNTRPIGVGGGKPSAPYMDSSLHGAFLKSIYDLPTAPDFNCQSKQCTWPDQYFTLGFRTTCADVTDAAIAEQSCRFPEPSATKQLTVCNLTTPGGVQLPWEYTGTMVRTVVSINTLAVGKDSLVIPTINRNTSEILRVAEYRAHSSFERLANSVIPDDAPFFDPALESITECSLFLSAYRIGDISAKGSNIDIKSWEVIPLDEAARYGSELGVDTGGVMDLVWNATDERPEIRMNTYDVLSIQSSLAEHLREVMTQVGDEVNYDTDKTFGLNIPLGRENATGLSEWFPKAARAMTSQIMSNKQETRQEITGFSTESVVHVRIVWGWLAVPAFEVVGVLMLLAITIIRSQLFRGIPQWKDSSTAVLFHNVEEDQVNKVKVLQLKVSGEREASRESRVWMVHAPSAL